MDGGSRATSSVMRSDLTEESDRAMDPDKTALERAFEIARSRDVKSIVEITALLKREGYDQYQIEGRSLRRQLRDLIAAA